MEDLKETFLILDGNIVISPEAGPDEYLEEYEEEDLGTQMDRDHRTRRKGRPVYTPTTDRKHQCRTCFYSTNDISNYRKHLKIHQIRPTIQCPKCTYAATDSGSLKSHMLTHTTDKPFKCAICGFASKSKVGVKRHVKRHEKPKEKTIFGCAECGKTYTHKKTLKYHLLQHIGDVYSCPDCDRKYPTRSRLRYHYRVHTGEKPYACTSCTYLGTSLSQLRAHVTSMHTTARPFVCSECSLGFKTKTSLRLHSKVHSNGRPFSCQLCSYRHVRKVGVELHMQLHHSSQIDNSEIKTEETQLISQTFACTKVEEEDTKSFSFTENNFNKDIDVSVDVIKSE